MSKSQELAALTDEELIQPAVPDAVRRRDKSAVALRLAGAPYEAIATTLGYPSSGAARTAVETVLANSVNQAHDLPHLRELTSRRIERLLRSVWTKATDPEDPDHLAYARTALALVDRHSRLMGLDAPQRLEVSTPDQETKERWIRGMIAQVKPEGVAREVDSIDEDIVDAEIYEP